MWNLFWRIYIEVLNCLFFAILGALNLLFWLSKAISKSAILKKSNSESLNWLQWQILTLYICKYLENLSGRKILKSPHCECCNNSFLMLFRKYFPKLATLTEWHTASFKGASKWVKRVIKGRVVKRHFRSFWKF